MSLIEHPWPSAPEIYPWVAASYPALVEHFGKPRRLLGGGMFGQAFDMGDGLVVKITMAAGEVSAAEHIIQIRRQTALDGFVYLETPVLLGEYPNHLISLKRPSPLWAIPKLLVEPLTIGEIRAVNRATRRARHKSLATLSKLELEQRLLDGSVDHDSVGTPFEFASETAQAWVDTESPAKKRRLLSEYSLWTIDIQTIAGFEFVGASMEEFLDLTGTPLFDVRPENCGRTMDGRVVCFDLMEPEKHTHHRRTTVVPKAPRPFHPYRQSV